MQYVEAKRNMAGLWQFPQVGNWRLSTLDSDSLRHQTRRLRQLGKAELVIANSSKL